MSEPAEEADAKDEYPRRLALARTEARALRQRERRIAPARLASFVGIVVVGWFAFGSGQIAGAWLWLPLGLFLALLILHDRVIRGRTRAERRAALYEAGIARLEDRWTGIGETGEHLCPEDHPYAEDLDLFGEGSLFQLICTARTAAGESQLARWLCAPATPAQVRGRQQAVEDLRRRVDLREDIALLGEDVRARFTPDLLAAWGQEPAADLAPALRALATALSALTLGSLVGWIFAGIGPLPFLLAALVQGAFAAALRGRVRPVVQAVSGPTRDLALLSGLLGRLEAETYAAPRLLELRRALESEGRLPSEQIARLRRFADLLDARANQFFAPIGALLLWGTHLAFAIEKWRQHCGPLLTQWIDAAGEIEALCSIAGYAYEHPEDPFPQVAEESPPFFDASELGHPLLPVAACVRNDVRLGSEPQAFVISGSNMSGKSTLLRSVGTNVVLALAGAPVRAGSLRMSRLQVAASLRVVDSLQTGTSHFYAEIKRLRQVMDLCEGPIPILFLLDEVLHGTNSHDRRIGAEAVVRGLLGRGALGLVTTHDLALAQIADELSPQLANVHFQDTLEGGQMHFDYRLQPGVVTKSNALELMRAVGLEV